MNKRLRTMFYFILAGGIGSFYLMEKTSLSEHLTKISGKQTQLSPLTMQSSKVPAQETLALPVGDDKTEESRAVEAKDGYFATDSTLSASEEQPDSHPGQLSPAANSSWKESTRKILHIDKTVAKPISSNQNQHIAKLKKQKILDHQSWQDQVSHQHHSAYLVENSEHPRYPYVIINEIRDSTNDSPFLEYVQVANHFLIRFQSEISPNEIVKFSSDYGLTIYRKLLTPQSYLFQTVEISIEHWFQLEEKILSDSRVATVEANSFAYSMTAPNDTLYSAYKETWYASPEQQASGVRVPYDIGWEKSWGDLNDCSSTIVAVIDSGIDVNHPDLTSNLLVDQGRNFTSADATDIRDGTGHGTHVAGTIGAIGNNATGFTGVCWQAAMIPIRVLGNDNNGTLADIADGIAYAAQTEARIFNISIGYTVPSPAIEEAIRLASAGGKLIVAAAGNSNSNNDMVPAFPGNINDPAIISVAALQRDGDLALFSNFGATLVDIAAPGSDILSTWPLALSNDDPAIAYQLNSGTSMAAPHVAGALALFWSYAPNLAAAEVKSHLLETAGVGRFATKVIAGSRTLDLSNLMTAIKAKARFTNIDEDQIITVVNDYRYTFDLTTEVVYSDIDKIQVLHNNLVLAEENGAATQITLDIPLGFDRPELMIRVVDVEGRVFHTNPIPLNLNIEKILNFSELDLSSLEGSISCELAKIESDGRSSSLFSTTLISEDACQNICGIIGPLAYTSLGQISCASPASVYYLKGKK